MSNGGLYGRHGRGGLGGGGLIFSQYNCYLCWPGGAQETKPCVRIQTMGCEPINKKQDGEYGPCHEQAKYPGPPPDWIGGLYGFFVLDNFAKLVSHTLPSNTIS